MPVAADYPFLDVLWTMLIFFLWIAWFMLLFRIIVDIFRRHDIGGGGKVLWMIFVILLPFLGVFVYLITQSRHMAERDLKEAKAAQSQFDDYVKSVSGGAASEIEKAQALLTSGAITQAEFDEIKRKALASS
ncbi:MAG TPA: SHOCT domain-containing protein [Gaiella sp.]|nr:SHOCT domain-containing protein [Gaiella sp.]